jgi:hypothetical protein
MLLHFVAALLVLRVPDPMLTPGATRTVTSQELCTPGSASRARHVSTVTKRAVYRRYHVTPRRGAYEIDHLVSLELGGANDLANLWPQPYFGTPNAHQKDALENKLHALVCHGQLSLAEAQRAIATDWIAAWHHYGGQAGPR